MIGMLKLTDDAGAMTFTPQPDIASYEVALLLNLLARLLANRAPQLPDWRGYLEEHKLSRHFVPN